LIRDGRVVPEKSITTDEQGTFAFEGLAEGRYQVEVSALAFQTRTTEPVFVGSGARVNLEVALPLGPLETTVVVTAATTQVLPSQIGAPVTVIDSRTLDALGKTEVFEALRLVPGAQVVQTGAAGGGTSVFIRGGDADFTKLLVDGVPVNDIGGGVDFSQFTTTGIASIETLRQSNSVLHGADALAGVINIATSRGRTKTPELQYTLNGGNLGTVTNDLSVGGLAGRVDYFGAYSHFNTDNKVPNNKYRNNVFTSRVGVALAHNTNVSGTVRFIDRNIGSPNGFDLFGIADDSKQTDRLLLVGVGADTQFSDRWQGSIRFGATNRRQRFENPTPTGTPFDPFGFGPQFLGNTVTLRGANGSSVTGQAILDFVFGPYPSIFESKTTRQGLYGTTTYHMENFDVSGGAHFEHEQGFNAIDGDATITHNNGGGFVEGRATLLNRVSVTGGVGFEHNAVYKNAVTPRASVLVFLRTPGNDAMFGYTRVTVNAGKGIKAPSTFQEQSTLFDVLGPLAGPLGVGRIGPERSRMFDIGLEQGLMRGRVRARVGYFNNNFSDLIEFVATAVLPQLGVSQEAAAATAAAGGANVNSQSYKAQGVETSIEARIGQYVRVVGSYTYLDAEVTKSLSGGVLEPAINPAFPDIQIGAFAPLVGQRPFRRPPHQGSAMVSYTRGPGQVTFAGYFVGHSDDSTFLTDGFFGNSMLLPNRDLDDAYQKVDLSGSYQVHPRAKLFVSIENLFDERYATSFGFPNLPRTARAGITVTLGGDR
jgi:iron complex outermembrane receptor protein/vitamin B12 transporter